MPSRSLIQWCCPARNVRCWWGGRGGGRRRRRWRCGRGSCWRVLRAGPSLRWRRNWSCLAERCRSGARGFWSIGWRGCRTSRGRGGRAPLLMSRSSRCSPRRWSSEAIRAPLVPSLLHERRGEGGAQVDRQSPARHNHTGRSWHGSWNERQDMRERGGTSENLQRCWHHGAPEDMAGPGLRRQEHRFEPCPGAAPATVRRRLQGNCSRAVLTYC